jgi:hypothetical protein
MPDRWISISADNPKVEQVPSEAAGPAWAFAPRTDAPNPDDRYCTPTLTPEVIRQADGRADARSITDAYEFRL